MAADSIGLWPTPTQDLLLAAATGPADRARPALEAWWRRIDLDLLDDASFRLLPQLHVNLAEHDIPAPSDRLRGIHRQSWYRNQLHVRVLAGILQQAAGADIDVLVTKGLSLALRAYRDVGARPMSDIDVVVRRRDVDRMLALLLADGWELAEGWDGHTVEFAHSHPLHHPDGWELDLHWHVSFLAAHDAADAVFWEAATTLDVEGAPVHLLDPADELFLLITHGLEWNVVAPFRWIVDALVLLERVGCDWDRLVATTTRLRLAVPVLEGLRGLRVRGHPVPDRVLDSLDRAPVPAWQRLEHVAAQQPWSVAWAPPTRLVLRRWRARGDQPVTARLRHVGAFLLWRLGVERPADVTAALTGWAARLRERRAEIGTS